MNIFLFYGVGGSIWSSGLDTLATALRRMGHICHVKYHWSYLNLPVTQLALIGHSMGGQRAVRVARNNPSLLITRLFTIDPSNAFPFGTCPPLPSNVKRAVNFFQHADFRIGAGSAQSFEEFKVPGISHYGIDDSPWVHGRIMDEMRDV